MAGVNHTRMQGKYLFFRPEYKKFKRSFHIKGIRLEEIFSVKMSGRFSFMIWKVTQSLKSTMSVEILKKVPIHDERN